MYSKTGKARQPLIHVPFPKIRRCYVRMKLGKLTFIMHYSQKTCEVLNIDTCKRLNLTFLFIIYFLNLAKIIFK